MRNPKPVLAISLDEGDREKVSEASPAGLETARDVETLRGRVAGEEFSAVVVAHAPSTVDALATVERVTDADPTVPVVVVADGDVDFVAEVVDAGADRYVPRHRGPEALAAAVEAAIETGRERRETELEADVLAKVLELAPIEIYAKDVGARHVRSTKTTQHDDVVGKTSTEFMEDERAEIIEKEDRELLERREPMEAVLSRYEVDATSVDDHDAGWVRSWKYPWYDGDDDLRGLIGFTQDVTGALETQEELRSKNDLLSQFASVVTHDLRNPLTVAHGNLELLREDDDDQYVDTIDRSLGRMNEIIDDLVRLSRGSDGTTEETPVPLAEAARTAWEHVDTAGATLDLAVDDAVIRADEGPLQQLFENLFRNAVEHSSTSPDSQARRNAVEHDSTSPDSLARRDAADGVTITVSLTDRGFYVADDGPGLPEDVETTLNAGEFNTGGLGLNIVHTIANRHDWGLRAGESEAGGARFTFTDCRLVRNLDVTATDRRPEPLDGATAVGQFGGGTHDAEDDRWVVTGRGRNFWRQVNEFYFVNGTVAGDADLVARLADFAATAGKAKAGIVVRSGLDPAATHAFVGLTPEFGMETLWQLKEGEGTQSRLFEDDVTPPLWLRLKREGRTITTFVSADGAEWTPVDEQRLLLGKRANYGLAVCSHDTETEATATFEDVSLAGVTWD